MAGIDGKQRLCPINTMGVIIVKKAIISLSTILVVSSFALGQLSVTTTASVMKLEYKSLDKARAAALEQAKLDAAKQIFGLRLQPVIDKENPALSVVDLVKTSARLLKIEGGPTFSEGMYGSEINATIKAYATVEDFKLFQPLTITQQVTVSSPGKSASELESMAQDQARCEALTRYDPRLIAVTRQAMMRLIHNVSYIRLSGKPTGYSLSMTGTIYSIEVRALVDKYLGVQEAPPPQYTAPAAAPPSPAPVFQPGGELVTVPSNRENRQLSMFPIKEPWGERWAVIAADRNSSYGWQESSKRVRSAYPPATFLRGLLYLHPVSRNEPGLIEGVFTIDQPDVTLRMKIANNQKGADWTLKVVVNEKEIGQRLIREDDWQTVDFSLADYYGQKVTILIVFEQAGDWLNEFAFFDKIEFVRE